MEKYGVMKTLKCETCDCVLHVRSNITDPEMEKLSHITEGHIHVWKEIPEDEGGDKGGDIQSE